MQRVFTSLGAVVSAVLASTCCWAPLLSLAGLLGVSSSHLVWLISIKPYLIAMSLGILGFALYRAYFPATAKDCCEMPEEYQALTQEEKKTYGFLSSKKFLWIVTAITVLMLLIPYL